MQTLLLGLFALASWFFLDVQISFGVFLKALAIVLLFFILTKGDEKFGEWMIIVLFLLEIAQRLK